MNESSGTILNSLESPMELPRSADLTVVSSPSRPSPVPRARTEFEMDDITEDLTTILELAKRASKPAPFYILLLSPYYPEPFSVKVGRYFHEVRRRMIESREFDRIHYAHTIYQKSRRLLKRAVIHCQTNRRARYDLIH